MDLAAEVQSLHAEISDLQHQLKEVTDEVEALRRILKDTEAAANDIRNKNIKLLERVRELEQRQDVIAAT